MWVQFTLQGTLERPAVVECRVDDDEIFDLTQHQDVRSLVNYIAEKAKSDVATLLTKGTIKVNMKVEDFESMVRRPTTPQQAAQTTVLCPADDTYSVLHLLRDQQAHMAQQQQILQDLVSSLGRGGHSCKTTIQPSPFDGNSENAAHWLSTYEHACDENGWTSDEQKIDNIGYFLSATAKKWYEFRILQQDRGTWSSWKESFLSSFSDNVVERWNAAIDFKYSSGSLVEYYFEKVRLLRLAEAHLPEKSFVALTLHGLPSDLRQMIQIRGPKRGEELLQCLRDLGAGSIMSTVVSRTTASAEGRITPASDRQVQFQNPGAPRQHSNWRNRTAATAAGDAHCTDEEQKTNKRGRRFLP